MISLGWTIGFVACAIVLGLALLYFWQHGQIVLKFDLGSKNV